MRPRHTLFEGYGAQAAGLIGRIKSALNQAVDNSGLSRDQGLDRLNALAVTAGVKLTSGNAKELGLATLEKGLNPADRDHIPSLLAINVLCAALHDTTALPIQLVVHGCDAMTKEDQFERGSGRACLAEKRARKEKRLMEAGL